jgi:hypothetical protein
MGVECWILIMNLNTIYTAIETTKVYIENFLSAFIYFVKSKDTILEFDTTGAELLKYLDISPATDISSFIDIAKASDLHFYDTYIADNNNFWTYEISPHDKILRTTLKLAWLTKTINENGVINPLQLLQTGSNKYICHPGSGRILILSYIFPKKSIKCFYVWNKKLDENPVFLKYPYKKINNVFSFLRMFKKSHRFRVNTFTLSTELPVPNWLKYAKESLALAHTDFYLEFITIRDNWFRCEEVSGKLFFRDLLQFNDDTHCTFGGIHMIKRNNLWEPE